MSVGAWEPNSRDLRAFAYALAERYSGHFKSHGSYLPRVRNFQAWNEPNVPLYLMPQYLESSNGHFVAYSPKLYRSMLNAFFAGVKQAQPHSNVLEAGTSPYGDPPGQGIGRMMPVTFLQNLFCLTPRLRPAHCGSLPHLDVMDAHPYGANPLSKAHLANNIGLPDLHKIYRIVNAARRFHHVLPAGHKPLWITEVDYATDPPTGAQIATQTRDTSLMFYELWSEGVRNVFWFQMKDPVGQHDSFAYAGLYFSNGGPKPAAFAYRFPFSMFRIGNGNLALWGRAPIRGRVTIERFVNGSWTPILGLRTTSGGIFYSQRRYSPAWLLRAQIGSHTSPGFTITG